MRLQVRDLSLDKKVGKQLVKNVSIDLSIRSTLIQSKRLLNHSLGSLNLSNLLFWSLHLGYSLKFFNSGFHSECHFIITFIDQFSIGRSWHFVHIANFLIKILHQICFLKLEKFLMQLEQNVFVNFIEMFVCISL